MNAMTDSVYNDDSKYNGEWKDSLKAGQGTLTYANGYVQNGTWKHDKINA